MRPFLSNLQALPVSSQTVGPLQLSNVFAPYAVFYPLKPLTPDYLWAALCMVGGCISFFAVPEVVGHASRCAAFTASQGGPEWEHPGARAGTELRNGAHSSGLSIRKNLAWLSTGPKSHRG